MNGSNLKSLNLRLRGYTSNTVVKDSNTMCQAKRLLLAVLQPRNLQNTNHHHEYSASLCHHGERRQFDCTWERKWFRIRNLSTARGSMKYICTDRGCMRKFKLECHEPCSRHVYINSSLLLIFCFQFTKGSDKPEWFNWEMSDVAVFCTKLMSTNLTWLKK